ncbi:transposase [Burkholderia cepacia]|uniref:IS110 family transposase n=1 Tax=Burkholderia cepacia TaxID=292 RepID=UPI00075B0CA5|nr:IS110 family transposase [Burkholderia cepacia]KVA53985.1 transposase [Burkholderia cepacia]KVA54487.1 transposase [Burkholderia cepacia]KVA63563.1 transposase [Burkholderia cepacia]KVA82890.1 transposase [Burkholderia cepacia]KVA85832.1 transposase [Burkholderia cepacia]
MQVLYPRCAGLDVHKDTIVACVRCVSAPEHHEVQSFPATTNGLLALSDWLTSHRCTHVAMEATGVYWKPVWHVLENSFELVLGNAAHIRNVPGRKTDVNDAMWIADLLAHGLIRSSFVPPAAIQELRDLTRTRKQLAREIAQHCLRIQKVLEDANLKLGSVLSDVLGGSGRAMLKAIVSGEDDPVRLASLAQGHARRKTSELREALSGRITAHHRAMLGLHLQVIDALEHTLADLDAAVGLALTPIRQQVQLLKTIPGGGDLTARVLVAEIGVDMTRFPDSAHLISWAGLCPRNDESAGKRRSTRVRKSGTWLKTALVTAAWAAVRAKNTYLHAQFLRIKARRGAKKAIVAVAASMLTAAWHMLRNGVEYTDLGPDYFNRYDIQGTVKRLLKRLTDLGYPMQPASSS